MRTTIKTVDEVERYCEGVFGDNHSVTERKSVNRHAYMYGVLLGEYSEAVRALTRIERKAALLESSCLAWSSESRKKDRLIALADSLADAVGRSGATHDYLPPAIRAALDAYRQARQRHQDAD